MCMVSHSVWYETEYEPGIVVYCVKPVRRIVDKVKERVMMVTVSSERDDDQLNRGEAQPVSITQSP